MRIIDGPKLDFKDVAILPKRSSINSRSEVMLRRDFKTLHSKQDLCVLPVVVSNLDSTGTIGTAEKMYPYFMMTALHKFHTKENLIKFSKKRESQYAWYVTGIRAEDYEKLCEVFGETLYKLVMVDVPNGYIQKVYEFAKKIRNNFPDVVLCVGNVVTPEAIDELILNCGVDVVKIGIAGGRFCKSYEKTGIYQPQLSTIIECADAAHGLGGLVMADGGIKSVGDFAKAFCAGADFVMAGGFFSSSHDLECDYEYDKLECRRYNIIYGMSSDIAIKKYYGGVGLGTYRTSEGDVQKVKCEGFLKDKCEDIIGGLKSTGSYIGARRLKDFSKCATFIRLT